MAQPAQHATVRGTVTYREGDGAELKIPEGPVQLHPAPDSMVLAWTASNDAAGQAAMPHAQYEQYVRDGKIVPQGGSAPDGRTHGR